MMNFYNLTFSGNLTTLKDFALITPEILVFISLNDIKVKNLKVIADNYIGIGKNLGLNSRFSVVYENVRITAKVISIVALDIVSQLNASWKSVELNNILIDCETYVGLASTIAENVIPERVSF